MTERPPKERRRVNLLAAGTGLVGVLLVQAAWILVVPPFRGLDEHDHAYKAAAVARGDWRATHEPSPQGWGEFVRVPSDVVTTAGPVCEALSYTTADNCTGTESGPDGMTTVASSAARYNPVFYFLIGSAALPFSGSEALYAMRGAAALMCALLMALAVAISIRWARSGWPAASILVAATPMLVYSSAIAAPNGIELAGAMLVWASLLALGRVESEANVGLLMGLLTVGAAPLLLVRSLGPLWLALIVMTAVMLVRPARMIHLVRRPSARACAAILVGLTAIGVAWSLAAGTNAPPEAGPVNAGSAWAVVPKSLVLWALQSIAAFPARDEMAPLALYAIILASWWALSATAWRRGSSRERWTLCLIVLVTAAVPVVITVATFERLGVAWQGRYGYPYAMGLLLVCGHVLDRSAGPGSPGHGRVAIWISAAAFFSAQLIGQLSVLRREVSASPLSGTDVWAQPHPIAVIALTAFGTALLVVPLMTASFGPPPRQSSGRHGALEVP